MNIFTEDIVEQATLYWLQELGYTTCHALEFKTDRQSYSDVILTQRLKNALL
ncbi:hypothetical protein [Gloeothece citriformis]|uniref:hypothetical protein n=1 Tax=Gloeothece citriformis TaxID=2546356 RepID=UPI000173D5D6|nr:hypothetical protein [Gloeothece citriformis]